MTTTTHKKSKNSRGAISAAVLVVSLLAAHTVQAKEIDLSFNYGYRQIQDEQLKPIYGSGSVFVPQLSFFLSPNFGLSAAYEAGFKKDGRIGAFRENSTLKIGGWEVSIVFRYPIRRFSGFVRIGAGYYGYKQDIDSPFPRFQVDHHGAAPLIGGGLEFRATRGFYLAAEVKYIPFKVSPFDIEVDLSGLRILFGLGYKITL